VRAPLLVILSLFILLSSCHLFNHSAKSRKLIVIGVDGMDPGFVERHWDALPNLARLRTDGYFGRLGTTTPPQSPVAWSTFITGLNPGEHGIFDFVHRDPATLQPFSSMARTEEPRFILPLGPYRLPLSTAKVTALRKGTPFWQSLSEHGVPVTVMHMPTNYPPAEVGHALAGMGTPDLAGTLGTFTLFTNDIAEMSRDVPGGRISKIHLEAGHAVLPLQGPENTLRKDHPLAAAGLIVDIDPKLPVARFQIGDELAVLKQGEWSGWLSAEFPLIRHLSSVRGTFRLYVKQLHPGFELYVSAINADPMSPALPVAFPSNWGHQIALKTGRFYTLGIPEDTAALRQHALTHSEFLEQAHLAFEDEKKLLEYSLRRFTDGFLFFYFSSVDENSHILWGRYDAELLHVYREVDACIGEVRRQIPDAEIIVMSDHGFSTFDRAVNLNSWLNHRGSLTLNGPPGDETSLSNINWSSTEAYALGLNGLYVNLAGRESHGTIKPGQHRQAITASLREQLLAWRDPLDGKQVITAVYDSHPSPNNAGVAPDLIIGYAPGYRASWQTGIGGTPTEEIEDNRDEWIADHCIDPAAVPGVLFTTSKFHTQNPKISDVTASILRFFGQ